MPPAVVPDVDHMVSTVYGPRVERKMNEPRATPSSTALQAGSLQQTGRLPNSLHGTPLQSQLERRTSSAYGEGERKVEEQRAHVTPASAGQPIGSMNYTGSRLANGSGERADASWHDPLRGQPGQHVSAAKGESKMEEQQGHPSAYTVGQPIGSLDHTGSPLVNRSSDHSPASRYGTPPHGQRENQRQATAEQYGWTLVDDHAPCAGGRLVKFVVFYPGAVAKSHKLCVLGAPDAQGWDAKSGAPLEKIATGVYETHVARLPAHGVLQYVLS